MKLKHTLLLLLLLRGASCTVSLLPGLENTVAIACNRCLWPGWQAQALCHHRHCHSQGHCHSQDRRRLLAQCVLGKNTKSTAAAPTKLNKTKGPSMVVEGRSAGRAVMLAMVDLGSRMMGVAPALAPVETVWKRQYGKDSASKATCRSEYEDRLYSCVRGLQRSGNV